jgi:hypothetical protein
MKRKPQHRAIVMGLLCLCLTALFCSSSWAEPNYQLSKGQTLYVSVYSNIFSAPKKNPYHLATILSIRNTDMANAITVTTADYYDTKGALLKKYYSRPVTLAPLESAHIYIPEEDRAGGTGANFIVKWHAAREVNAPLVESVMFGMRSGQGISFTSTAREIR